VLLRALILACALAPASDVDAPSPTTSTTPVGLDVVIVRAPEPTASALRDALRVRLPDAEVLPFADESFARVSGRPFVYLEVTIDDAPDGATRLLFVLSDGRAYLRDVRPEPDQPARSVAATIANTLGAIEEERFLPDRTAVDVPRPEPPAEPMPAREQAPPAPVTSSTDIEPPASPATPERARAPRAHVGVGASVVGSFGLAPATPAARFPVGGGLDAAVRLPIGVTVEAGLRGLTRAHSGYRMLRLRGHVAAGFTWARQRLELGATIGPTIEGWALRDADGRVGTRGPEGGRRQVLLGAAAAIVAGVLLPPWPSARAIVRVSARAELAVSALPSGSAARVLHVAPPMSTIFTAGGVETMLGLDVRVWLPVYGPPARPR
jgi:hypothetical protein